MNAAASVVPAGTAHLADVLTDAARRHPDRDAIVFPQWRATYRELHASALARAASFEALDLSPGSHVGLLLTNRPEFCELLLGATFAGHVPVLLNARYKAYELRHVVQDSEIAVLFTSRPTDGEGYDFPATLSEAFPGLGGQPAGAIDLPDAPGLRRVFVLDGDPTDPFESYARFLDAGGESPGLVALESSPRDAATPLVMLYTSGTTSAPKGCHLSHVNVVGKGCAFAELFDMTAESRFWNPLPVFHVGFVMPLAATMAVGATLVSMRRFEPVAAMRLIADEAVTHVFPSFPQLWLPIIDHPDFDPAVLAHVRRNLLVGPPELLERAQRATPDIPVISCYGMTEGTSVFTAPRPSDSTERRLRTEGRPLPGLELRIVDLEDQRELPPGETGEIQIRGYSVAQGYHNDPQRSVEAFLPDGWFRTGDRGSTDADGYLSFRGRTKDMLKVGGENVAAVEVESFLGTHPEIRLAQVVGVPDDRLTEVVAAFVEVRPGSSLRPEDVVAYCRGTVSTFKVPRYVTFVEEWPMSTTKILKRALVDLPRGPRLT